MQAKSHLLPSRYGILKGNRPILILMRREILPAVWDRLFFRITVQVGRQRRQHGHRALNPHPEMQRAAAPTVLNP